jgi:hypothetical protein
MVVVRLQCASSQLECLFGRIKEMKTAFNSISMFQQQSLSQIMAIQSWFGFMVVDSLLAMQQLKFMGLVLFWIIVTVNYRLGIFGFMTLGTDNENGIAGNQGMWDQYECN